MKLVLCILGKKGYAVLESIINSGKADLLVKVWVGTDPAVLDDYSDTSVRLCRSLGIPFLISNTPRLNSKEFNYILAAGWRWLIRGVPEDKLIVFHDSLLPRYRGFAPLVSALLNYEVSIGVTVLFGTKEYDRGKIIAQESLKVEYPTTISNEIERIVYLYGKLTKMILRGPDYWEVNEQDESEASYSVWLDDEDYRIQWRRSAEEIAHFISCVSFPYLGASAYLDGKKIRVQQAKVYPNLRIENPVPGKVFCLVSETPVVICGHGLLQLVSVSTDEGQSLIPWKRLKARIN